MKAAISAALTIIVYCIIALVMFDSVFSPIGLFLDAANGPGTSFWRLVLAASAALAMLLTSRTVMPWLSPVLRPPLFLAAWMLLTVFSVGTYLDWRRQTTIFEFQPDLEIQHSFYDSIREVPREFQFYVHSAALKHCVPYIWSYRSMRLVEVKPDIAVNVLPADWMAQCGIKRTH